MPLGKSRGLLGHNRVRGLDWVSFAQWDPQASQPPTYVGQDQTVGLMGVGKGVPADLDRALPTPLGQAWWHLLRCHREGALS